MNTLRKIFTFAVVVATIFGAIGFVGHSAKAAVSGDLIKMNGLSTVYYLGADNTRKVFPSEKVYFSWYKDFSMVKTISQAELESYPLGGNITYRPGTNLVKITTNPKVYAVEPGGILRAIPDEATALNLYGANWNKMIHDVSDAFWFNYQTGTPLAMNMYPAGTIAKMSGSAQVYYFTGTEWRLFSNEAGFFGNNFDFKNVVTVPSSWTSFSPVGNPINGAEAQLFNPGGSASSTPTGSGLSVALSSDTPASSTIPENATAVPFMKFNVTAANDGNVVIDTVKAKRVGVGNYADLGSVYLYDGSARLTNARSVNSDNEVEFSALNYTVPRGTTRTLTIVANVDDNAGGEHAFQIPSASSIVLSGGGAVSGSFPITGNTMTFNSSVSAGTLLLDPSHTSLTNPTVGDANASVAQFKITANSSEDIWFKSITLKQDGTINTSDLSNFKLMQASTDVPVTASVNGRRITLTLNSPLKITNGTNKVFTVKADISANADVADTVILYVENAADILATSNSYGFGVNPDISAYDTTGEAKTLTLQGGGVTISNLSDAARDAKTNTTEIELMEVSIKAVTDMIEVQKMTLTVNTTKATSGTDYGTYLDTNNDATWDAGEELLLKNIKLKDAVTGQTLGSAKAISDATNWASGAVDVDATLSFTYTDYFTVAKGATRNVRVVADIDNDQISGVIYKANLDFTSPNFTAKDSQDNTITDVVPAAVISGNNVTTRTSALTVSRASTPETRTVVKGSTVDSLGMIFATATGEGNEIKLSSLTLHAYVDANVDGTFASNTEGGVNANTLVQQVSLYDGNTLVAGPASVDSSGNVIFNSSKFVGGFYMIPAGTNKTLVAKAVVSGTAPYGGTDDAYSFTFASADVTAEDDQGTVTTTVTGTNLNGTTSPSVSIRVTDAGTITTSIDSGRPDAQVLIAGVASEQEVSRINLTATKEDFTVSEMTVAVSESGSYDDVESVRLYNTAGTALTPAIGLDSNGKANFTGMTLSVPKLVDTVVVVKAKLAAMGERTTATDGTAGVGADTGDSITFTLSTSADDFRAVGQASSTVDNAANAAVGSTHLVRKAKVNFAMVALPGTELVAGLNTLMRFTLTGDGNSIAFKGLQPTMAVSTDAAITAASVYLYDITGGSEVQLNTTGVNGSAFIPVDDAKVMTIAAGQTRTFEIRATVTTDGTGDSIQTNVVKDTASLSTTTETSTNAIADAQNNFIWSDRSADTHTLGTSVEWINSYLLTPWPTSFATLSN